MGLERVEASEKPTHPKDQKFNALFDRFYQFDCSDGFPLAWSHYDCMHIVTLFQTTNPVGISSEDVVPATLRLILAIWG